MKKLIIYSALLGMSAAQAQVIVGDNATVLTSENAGTSWTAQSPVGLTGNLFTFARVNNDTMFVGGASGIFRSTDGGDNFASVNASVARGMITYNAGQNIRVVGRSGANAFIRSDNYGDTWSLSNESNSNSDGLSISAGTNRMYVVQDNNKVHRFNIGSSFGSNRTEIFDLASIRINSVLNNDSIILLASELGRFFKSLDSGKTFTEVALPGHTGTALRKIKSSPDGTRITIVGLNGYIANSQDGGKTWLKINTTNGAMTSKSLAILDVFYVTNDLVFISGQDGDASADNASIARSTDGGVSFTQVAEADISGGYSNDNRWRFESISFADENVGYIAWNRGSNATDYQIFRTNDGGLTWNRIKDQNKQTLDGISLIIVKDINNIILSSTRGSQSGNGIRMVTINPIDSIPGYTKLYNDIVARDVYFGTDTLAVSNMGVYKITEMGAVWTKVSNADLPANANLGISKNFVVGSDNGLYRTEDNYVAWQKVEVTTDKYSKPRAVFAVDNDNIYIVGNSGMVLKSSNQGGLLTLVNQTGPNLRGVYFTDANTGWVVGEDGYIAYTTNGGAEWTVQNSGVSSTLNAVYAYDANSVLAVGNGGVILKSTNGGTNWTAMNSGTSANLNYVNFTDNAGEVDLPSLSIAPLSNTLYAAGQQLEQINYTVSVSDFASGNTFTLQLSNASGNWSAPTVLATQSGQSSGAFANVELPGTLTAGEGYKLRIVANNPAVFFELSQSIEITPVSAYSSAHESVHKVYPNPNSGQFFVESPGSFKVEVYGGQGLLLNTLEGRGSVPVNLTNKGIYTLRITHAGGTEMRKVVIE